MLERDRVLLEDIRHHGRECLEYLKGVRRDRFLRDRKLQLITERLLEIVGEAAGSLSEDLRAKLDYDWRGVRGLRNVLAHQYGAVDPDLVWGVVRNRLPKLLGLVAQALRA